MKYWLMTWAYLFIFIQTLLKRNIILQYTTIVKGVNNVVQFMAFLRCPLSSLYCLKKKMNRLGISWSILLKNKNEVFNAFLTSSLLHCVMNSFMTLIYLSMLKKMSWASNFFLKKLKTKKNIIKTFKNQFKWYNEFRKI